MALPGSIVERSIAQLVLWTQLHTHINRAYTQHVQAPAHSLPAAEEGGGQTHLYVENDARNTQQSLGTVCRDRGGYIVSYQLSESP